MLSPQAEEALLTYSWPGNVRELENVIERAVVMSGQETLMPEAFAFEDDSFEEDFSTRPRRCSASRSSFGDRCRSCIALDQRNRVHRRRERRSAAESQNEGTLQATLDRAATVRIEAALSAADGNRVDAAAALGVDRTTLSQIDEAPEPLAFESNAASSRTPRRLSCLLRPG